MNNTIWKRVLVFVTIPFLCIFVALSAFIVRSVYRDKAKQAGQDLRNLAWFNSANLLGYINNIEVTVATTAAELESIDASELGNAREFAEHALFAMFENPNVYNAWLAYEPNAFDGEDPQHTRDYPGAPSGRFIRSYVRGRGGYVEAPDMDEALLSDPNLAKWYIFPKTTGKKHISFGDDSQPAYDYGLGEGAVNSLGVSAPIIVNGRFIGCVGADALMDGMMLGDEIIPGASSAIFSSRGMVIYAKDNSDVGKDISQLGLSDAEAVRSSFLLKRERYLEDEYFKFLNARSYVFFKPLQIGSFDQTFFLCAAVSRGQVLDTVMLVLLPISVALLLALVTFAGLLFYIALSISRPIHMLTVASDMISLGNLDRDIPALTGRDEIGVMARSLRRMVEQFRVYITLQSRSRELLDLYVRLNEAVYQHTGLRQAFDAIIDVVAQTFRIQRASLVLLISGKAQLLSRYEAGFGLLPSVGADGGFKYHSQVAVLLAGKKYIFLNSRGVHEQKLAFASGDTASVCILPIFLSGALNGYIIMEDDGASGAFVNDDTALIFISDTLSYILTQKDRYAAAKPNAASGTNANEYAGVGADEYADVGADRHATSKPIAASNPAAFDR
ncbi:MAG: HAMP domain-containing protein, partial [Clostridiales bacterium]|nr:HAMP domain-containing protein [Clostridiales bacterium]